jgi:carboxyl-terminal processing protease
MKPARIVLLAMTSTLLALLLVAVGFVAGLYIPDSMISTLNLPGLKNTTSPIVDGKPVTRDQLFAPFWQAWDFVHRDFVKQPVDDKKLMQGAIRGMMESLGDAHTAYMTPDEYQLMADPLQGEYEGIGAIVDIKGDFVTFISFFPGSPAELAGLKSGDMVMAIDGNDMTGIDGNLVLKQIRGPSGTEVTLTLKRKDQSEPVIVKVKRQKIQMNSVESKMLDGDIAYIQLYTFGEKTNTELKEALQTLLKNNPKGLILDLRNNGGGLLNTAIEVASQFMKTDLIMNEEYGTGDKKVFNTLGKGLATDIPMVVLVNGGSASASEIVAGALQDSNRAKLVGEKSYGKGSVQNWIPLDNDQGAVRITTARWLTPNNRQINDKGLEPDVVITFTEEDIKANKDVQLNEALLLLKGE